MIDFVFNHFYGLFYDLALLFIAIGIYKTAMSVATKADARNSEEEAAPAPPRTWLP